MKEDPYKWLSADDLKALSSGDMSKVSVAGLRLLAGKGKPEEAPNPAKDFGGLPFSPLGFDTGLTLPNGVSNFLAGTGKGMTDLARGAGQYFRAVSDDDVDASKKRDAPLLNAGGGFAGHIFGQVLPAIPAAMAAGPGLTTGATLGAIQGALQPTGEGDSTLANIRNGAIFGTAGNAVVPAGRALYQGARALVEPFSRVGQERIAGRVLERFAEDPARIAAAGGFMGPGRTGAVPTLAEETGDRGIASLQDSLRSLDPTINTAIERQLAGNNAARVERLRELAGQNGGREADVFMRGEAARPQYEAAFQQQIDPAATQAGQQLMQAPAIRQAAAAARTNAQNAGQAMAPEGSIQGLHNAKLALDDMIAQAENATSAGGVNNAAALRAARDRLVAYIEQNSDAYRGARQTYAEMSRPVNQADVGEELLRATANTTDLPMGGADAGVPRLMPDKFLGAVRNGERTVQRATGRNLGGLEDVMTPGQMNLVNSIAREVDRSAAVGRAGNGPGSATAKRLASQNLVRQIAGPTGLPQSWAESALLSNILRPVQFAYGTAEPAIQQVLARGLLDPAYAAALVRSGARQPVSGGLLGNLPDSLLATGRIGPTAGLLASER